MLEIPFQSSWEDRWEGETLNAGKLNKEVVTVRQPRDSKDSNGKERIYTINGWVRDEREVSSMAPGFQLRSLGGAFIHNWKCRRESGWSGTPEMHSGLVGRAAEGAGWSWSACVCVSDGDPLSDVGCSPLFHSEAALVEVPSDLDLLLCCHSLCHLPSHPKATSADNPKVRI